MRKLPVALVCFLLLQQPMAQAQAPATTPDIATLKAQGNALVDAYADRMGRLGDAIYSYSELGFQEHKTVALLKKELTGLGFRVQTGLAGMPTAYIATYGSGSPRIGMMADYDCIPGASQKPAVLVHDPIVPGAPGHGEGHSAGQPTLVAAAKAIKELKDKYKLPGTIVVYGGPAEELGASRPYMVRAGSFNDVEAMLDVHIGTNFSTAYGLTNLAIMSVQWTFHGQQAHAAEAWRGRSALDAVEVMDVATNYMREHIEPAARVHYVITEGGKQPNVVPDTATVWYYLRETTAAKVWALFHRTREAAKGAAASTGTTVSERIFSANWQFNGNKALAELVQANIEAVGMPQWSDDDQAFARAFQKSMGAPVVGMSDKVKPLHKAIQAASSTDASDVTWQAPYVRIEFPAQPVGALAGHHWSAGIAPATPLAHKAMAATAKVLLGSYLDMMTDPAKLTAIRADFADQLSHYPKWQTLLPPDAEPTTFVNVETMAKYAPALAPFEYDPNSKQTYLQFLKIPYPPAMPASAVGKASNAEGGDTGAE
jgi:aminobenzoyl-glutamate utilization protein B